MTSKVDHFQGGRALFLLRGDGDQHSTKLIILLLLFCDIYLYTYSVYSVRMCAKKKNGA